MSNIYVCHDIVDDIQEQLKQKGIDNICPKCNEDSMKIINGILYNTFIHYTETSQRNIIRTCDNCGYIELYNINKEDQLGGKNA